jgi:TetR/AcrR family transcriptional regulator
MTVKKRNAQVSKKKILEAALIEIATKGLDGARVDVIVKLAGVNKNLLYHYFKNKDHLFLTLLENAYAEMRCDQAEKSNLDAPPKQAMEMLVRNTFRHFIEHPEIVSLLASANVHRARHLDNSEVIQKLFDPLVDSIGIMLKRGAKEGVFRKQVDVVDLYISIAGLGYFYQSCRFTLGKLFSRDLSSPEIIKQREEHIVDVIMSYLRAD